MPATPWLIEALRQGESLVPASEQDRCQFIVAPILLTCRKLLNNPFVIYSGIRLDVDPERGLNGECDFFLARSLPTVLVLQTPLMVILERPRKGTSSKDSATVRHRCLPPGYSMNGV